MWQVISNISSIVTCVLFVFYIVGHIWKVIVTRNIRYEKFKVLPFDTSNRFEENDNIIIIDNIGHEFSISSEYGIKHIRVYKVNYILNDSDSKKRIPKKFEYYSKTLNINDTLYVKCDLGETIPTTQVEIERMDYTKVTFELYSSGKTGHILVNNYKFKMTFKSFLYYLCI